MEQGIINTIDGSGRQPITGVIIMYAFFRKRLRYLKCNIDLFGNRQKSDLGSPHCALVTCRHSILVNIDSFDDLQQSGTKSLTDKMVTGHRYDSKFWNICKGFVVYNSI